MPSSQPLSPDPTGTGRRRSATGVARALSLRGALALHPVDGALPFAVRAALAMALPALPLVLTGHPRLAVYAMLGAFTTTFGRTLPYRRRAWVLALVAVAMAACVGCGSLLAAWAHPLAGGAGAAAVVLATAAVAGLAKFGCDAARLSGLGAVLLLFSFAVAANGSPTPEDVLPRTALAVAGAATAWALSLSGWWWHPDRPERLVVAAALRELAGLMDSIGSGGSIGAKKDATGAGDAGGHARHRATATVLLAYRTLGLRPPAADERGDRGGVCGQLTDLSWSLLITSARQPPEDPAGVARQLRRQVRLLVDGRRRAPTLLPELSAAPAGTRTAPAGGAAATGPAAARTAELLDGPRPDRSGRLSVLAVPALRMVLGTGLAGGLAVALHLGHGYWAAISAAAVLHSVNVRTTAQRAAQRTLGTLAGLLLALGVLAAHPGAVELAVVIVLLEFLLEYLVVRNYGLGVVFLTPLALLMSELASPTPVAELVRQRALASVLGIVIGLACALAVVHDRAAVRVERALAACADAAERAERALGDRSRPPTPAVQVHLAAAVVELRDADDAAAGELWPAGIDPAVLAAAEQRAYLLLHRLVDDA